MAAATKARKGERTRQRIVEATAPVFNRLGYAGASMRDLLAVAGVEKGGLYNHFGSKEALAVAAFDHSISLMTKKLAAARAAHDNAADQLVATIRAFGDVARRPVIEGGCPIMNTAIEADDTNPELSAHARRAMHDWHRLIGAIVRDGIAAGELEPDIDKYALASIVTASLEGALMLSQLHDDPVHMDRVVQHLEVVVDGYRVQPHRRDRASKRSRT